MRKKKEANIERIPRFIDESEILRPTTRGWYIGKRKLGPEEIAGLKADAKHFSDSVIWQLMRRDIHYLAYVKATAGASTEKDLFYANAMYHNLEILEKFIENCKTL